MVTAIKRFFRVAYVAALCITIIFCIYSCNTSNEDDPYEKYQEGYNEGYANGYEKGWDDLLDIMYDELDNKEEDNNEAIHLMFDSVYKGDQLKDGETWYAGNFALRYHLEQDGYLHFDIRFTDFDIKTICNGDVMEFMEKFPVTCYIGTYNEDGQFVAVKENFVGEKIFLDSFEFTHDGYLTDYYDNYSNSETLCIIVFSNGEIYSAKYNIDQRRE